MWAPLTFAPLTPSRAWAASTRPTTSGDVLLARGARDAPRSADPAFFSLLGFKIPSEITPFSFSDATLSTSNRGVAVLVTGGAAPPAGFRLEGRQRKSSARRRPCARSRILQSAAD